VALALEDEGLVVSESVKFPVRLRTRRQDHAEVQTHGYEVDLVAACAGKLVLASVKSYLGSRGVVAEHVTGETEDERARRRYSLLNRPEVRGPVIRAAAERYGYLAGQVEMRLYVGKFSPGIHEAKVRAWARRQRAGAGPIAVYGLGVSRAGFRGNLDPRVCPGERRFSGDGIYYEAVPRGAA